MNGDWYTTWGFWVGLGGLVVGALAVWYGVWARNHPKRSGLVGRISESALMPDVETDHEIQVTMSGYLVPKPHLVRITLTNLGPNDLVPSAFEGGYLRCISPTPEAPDEAALRYTMVPIAILHTSSPCTIVYPKGQTIGVELTPCQLRVGETVTITLIIAGKPDFTWEDRLAEFTLQAIKGERPASFELSVDLPLIGAVPVTWRRARP